MFSFSHTRLYSACAALLIVGGILCAPSAQAFILGNPDFDPWLSTASGTRSGNGQPVTLTWSIVGDGTSTPNENGGNRVGSTLITFLDATFGGTPSPHQAGDLTARPWFDLLQQSFDRWEELGGVDYEYEPNDDNSSLAVASGLLGTRGDIRIGGRNVDDVSGTLAFNYFPNIGDMVLDTSEGSFFVNPANNFRRFRNTLAHELGHGLNLEHVVSFTDALLLEPSIGTAFDGPQLDEVRAVHFFYGDVYEKSNNNLGNNIAARATDLGTIVAGDTASIGTSANVPTQLISSSATDFVSISNLNDSDYFSFTVAESSFLEALLTPLGGVFSQAEPGFTPALFDANARSDLALTIFDTDGVTPLLTLDETGVGASESRSSIYLEDPGQYYARITGAADTIQLYQLDLAVDTAGFQEADFNEDTRVDGDDLSILSAALGVSSSGDTDDDDDTDGADFLMWQQQFSGGLLGNSAIQVVPEPASAALLLIGWALFGCRIRS